MSLVDDICEPGKLTQFATPPSAQDADDIIRRIKADLHPGQLAFVEAERLAVVVTLLFLLVSHLPVSHR